MNIYRCSAMLLLMTLIFAAPTAADDAWEKLGEDRRESIESLARDYMKFISVARTELTSVTEAVRLAEEAGFRHWEEGGTFEPGRGFIVSNRGRAVIIARVGERPLADGAHVIAAHIDSPRLDVKARPLYEKSSFALLQTVPHGGIKNYQWANIPLALLGHVDMIGGKRVAIEIGLDANDPVFMIPDLAPHVDKPRRDRKSRQVIKGEELDPVVGSIPGADGVEAEILELLAERYGMARDDFVSAELSLVPAMRPREVGLDRGLITAYGQDDKVCSFAGLQAIFDEPSPKNWSIVYLADNEESGSRNNTGANSEFLNRVIEDWLAVEGGSAPVSLRRVLERTVVASADATTGINPMDASVHESGNASRVNGGVVIKRYGRGNDANSEVLAEVRRILEAEDLPWQTHTYKVGVGGGGTLGGFLSMDGMEVFDIGAAGLSMHSPAEIFSKADVYALYAFMRRFLADDFVLRSSDR